MPAKLSSRANDVIAGIQTIDDPEELRKVAGITIAKITGIHPMEGTTVVDRINHLIEDHGLFSHDVMRALNPPKHGCGT